MSSFADGRDWLLTRRRRLPTGQTQVELLTAAGRRRALLLDSGDDRPEVHELVAAALIANDRRARGRRLGEPS